MNKANTVEIISTTQDSDALCVFAENCHGAKEA